MKILGISAFYHDSSAAITIDGKIIAAVQEERFTRKKHDPSFPSHSIRFCLDETGLTLDELDAVVFYDKPFLKFERLLETYYAFAPKGIRSFIQSMPIWLNEKLFIKKRIKDELKDIEDFDKKKMTLLFPEHHLSHAASAFYPSPFEEAAIITIDGVGEWATASICKGEGNKITVLKEMQFPHSVGLLYSAFTYFLGFKVNSGEYKLMGLAPYGNPHSKEVKQYIETIKKKLITIHEDGSIWINQKYFDYATGLKMTHNSKWEQLFNIKKRESSDEFLQKHSNLALAIQKVTEDIVFKMAHYAKKITASDNLCLSGGVALNCVANGKLKDENIFKNIFVQPASGDAGGSLGAALAGHHIYFNEERKVIFPDAMQGSYLGCHFNVFEIQKFIQKSKAVAHQYDDQDTLMDTLAQHLSEGKIVGWFQGKMEYGPRALGARSIIGDPRDEDMQKRMNLKIKYRESFRPFAPSVLEEDVQDFFKVDKSPYMLLVADVNDKIREPLPDNYHELEVKDKLYVKRSSIPAITHVDFSARVQTVSKTTNPRFWNLLQSFKAKTGIGMLINTSFNVRGEPIVCTPNDAYSCFMNTEMDILVIEDFIFYKIEQPEWDNSQKWKQEFLLD
jgi:carbamoyltransferase